MPFLLGMLLFVWAMSERGGGGDGGGGGVPLLGAGGDPLDALAPGAWQHSASVPLQTDAAGASGIKPPPTVTPPGPAPGSNGASVDYGEAGYGVRTTTSDDGGGVTEWSSAVQPDDAIEAARELHNYLATGGRNATTIRHYQQRLGVRVDGIVGPETTGAMNRLGGFN